MGSMYEPASAVKLDVSKQSLSEALQGAERGLMEKD